SEFSSSAALRGVSPHWPSPPACVRVVGHGETPRTGASTGSARTDWERSQWVWETTTRVRLGPEGTGLTNWEAVSLREQRNHLTVTAKRQIEIVALAGHLDVPSRNQKQAWKREPNRSPCRANRANVLLFKLVL